MNMIDQPPIILHPSGPIAYGPPTRLAPGRIVPIVGLDCAPHPEITQAFLSGTEFEWSTEWFMTDEWLLLAVTTPGPPPVTFGVAFDERKHRAVLEQARKAGGLIGLGAAPVELDPAATAMRIGVVGVQFSVAGLRTARRLLGGRA